MCKRMLYYLEYFIFRYNNVVATSVAEFDLIINHTKFSYSPIKSPLPEAALQR